jgi:phospholipase/carboxylesterase
MRVSRRDFVTAMGACVSLPQLLACSSTQASNGGPGRLTVRHSTPRTSIAPGLHSLPLDGADIRLYVPPSYTPEHPARLIVMFHGATQDADFSLDVMRGSAVEHGHVLLAPKSAGITWDGIRDEFGADVERLDRALGLTFEQCAIDPATLTLAGFSDGASYALSLGMINGDLFPNVLAFSPGFAFGTERHGRPRFFVSHGTNDQILPIAQTSRRLVPLLREGGYDVTYHEFDGPHTVPADIRQRAMAWLDS